MAKPPPKKLAVVLDIIAKRDQALAQANAKIEEIRDEMDKIDLAAQAAGKYTKKQKNEWKGLDKTLKATLNSKKDIILISLAKIDNSTEVKNLVGIVGDVNKRLKSTFESVQNVSQTIKDITALVQKVTALLTALTSLAAGLP